MAEIVLIYPITGLDLKGVSVWLPMSVLAVASGVVDSYDTAVIDQRVAADWRGDLRAALGPETLCVGISTMTGAQIGHALEAARLVRELCPGLPIVWGGNHPTLLPEQTARHPLVDIVVMGEGERTFRALVDALRAGRDWRSVADIAYKSGGSVRTQGSPYSFADPEMFSELPYHLINIEHYINSGLGFGSATRAKRILPFISSFGCPHPCAFCCQPVLSGRRWRCMSAAKTAERASHLVERFGLDAVEFFDEEFFADRKRGVEISERIAGRFSFLIQTRMDDLLNVDLPSLERSGLVAVQPGIESGSDRILELIRKHETVAQYRRANRTLAGTGIRATYNFMMGFPGETHEDLQQSVDLALEMLGCNAHAQVAGFYVFVPYPGSELFDAAVHEGGFHPPECLEGWISMSRHWAGGSWVYNQEALKYLSLTSKIIDGERLLRSFGRNPLARTSLSAFSRWHRRRWRAHDFRFSWDVRLMAALARASSLAI